MKKVITALCNPTLNIKLREENSVNVYGNDIQYQDGIFECLENNIEIDYLVLSELIPGKYDIKKLIDKIIEKNKYIKIIIILENIKEELENYLYSKSVYKIFYDNEVEIEDIIYIIKHDNIENDKIIQEIESLKKILIKNHIEFNKENSLLNNIEEDNRKKYSIKNINIKEIFVRIKNKLIKNIDKNKFNIINKKIISILGTGGIGKSIITINIANLLKENNYKVLILDFDILNNSLHTILGVNKYPEKIKEKLNKNNLINNQINIKELCIKINKSIDLISGINLLFDNKYKLSSTKIKFILEELMEKYDYIIIDNSAECFLEYTKNIIKNSNINIFLIESNLTEIKKAKRLLEIYNREWKIPKDQIELLINKYNKYSINDTILKNIFDEYKIIGKIDFDSKYNDLINKKYKNNRILKYKINKELNKIFKYKERE